MARVNMSVIGKGLALTSGVLAAALSAPAVASADPVSPTLVHASENNACKLNVRAGAGTSTALLHTLSCDNYTTCVQNQNQEEPCAPYVVGEQYSCVGKDNNQVTDNRWAQVTWRGSEPSYVAVSCAALGTLAP